MVDEENRGFEAKLRKVLQTTDITNTLTEPLTNSIIKLLQISANSLNSDEASIIVGDDSEYLRFLFAVGKVADQLVGMKIPLGKGIAGYVYASGQPMAVADVDHEESFYKEVDKNTGYSTQMILATPLRYDNEIIGVLEFVNRIGEPPYQAFTPLEMDKAAFFAEAIAALVKTYITSAMLGGYGHNSIDNVESKEDNGMAEIHQWLRNQRLSPEHLEMISLAGLVREISCRGDSERILCREILESFVRFSDDQTKRDYLDY